jgi:hypothetical protein
VGAGACPFRSSLHTHHILHLDGIRVRGLYLKHARIGDLDRARLRKSASALAPIVYFELNHPEGFRGLWQFI